MDLLTNLAKLMASGLLFIFIFVVGMMVVDIIRLKIHERKNNTKINRRY